MILDQLIYTVADGSKEASYLTPVTNAAGVVQRYERTSRNFMPGQEAEFLAGINSVSAAQIIAANDAKVLAEINLAAEQSAHATTQAALTTALAKLAEAGIP
jgi:hypothetical protein